MNYYTVDVSGSISVKASSRAEAVEAIHELYEMAEFPTRFNGHGFQILGVHDYGPRDDPAFEDVPPEQDPNADLPPWVHPSTHVLPRADELHELREYYQTTDQSEAIAASTEDEWER